MYACKKSVVTFKAGCAKPCRGLDGCGLYLRTPSKPLSRLILRVAVFESTPYVPVRVLCAPALVFITEYCRHTFMQLPVRPTTKKRLSFRTAFLLAKRAVFSALGCYGKSASVVIINVPLYVSAGAVPTFAVKVNVCGPTTVMSISSAGSVVPNSL